ncbi:elongin BC and Polycomb repressive complex 2-associated protein-like [Setaria italica]|uniref:elongin BC and Polycomb repressive complex 2-associated protein-like n=1 Tax=Setaria italica TaxID=4555 RepID=UPI0007199CCD|nr:elongin BC and Polycomb repressive complex 2-associated protein-like [Setaria italica]
MAAYYNEVRKLEDKFNGLEINHVARRSNKAVDELEPGRVGDAPPTPDSGADPEEVGNAPPVPDSDADPGKVGDSPSGLDPEADPSNPEVMEIDANLAIEPNPPPDWRAPYLNYLIRETLPTNKTEACRIARRAKSFVIID